VPYELIKYPASTTSWRLQNNKGQTVYLSEYSRKNQSGNARPDVNDSMDET